VLRKGNKIKLNICRVLPTWTIVLLVFSGTGYCENGDKRTTTKTLQTVNYLLDFSDYKSGPIDSWLKEKGFKFERDAQDRKKLDLDVNENGLVLGAKKAMFGIMVNEGVDLDKFSSIRLEWGINKYPEGASWEKNVNNETLTVIVFFGYDKVSSGHLLIPNSPYFIGFFLGREEVVGKSYVGRYFKKSGRYVCLGNPKTGELVTSEYDLVSAFKQEFKRNKVPPISGVALAIDTTKAKDGGKAGAYLRSIEFLD